MSAERTGHAKLSPEERDRIRKELREELRHELHDDWRALFEATAQGPAPGVPPLPRPPLELDSLDARSTDRLKREILREADEHIRDATGDLVSDDDLNNRISDRFNLALEKHKGELLQEFKQMNDEAIAKLRTEFFDIFEDLGMPLNKGERLRATRERLHGLFKMHESGRALRREFFKQLRNAAIGHIVSAVLLISGWMYWRGGNPK